MKDRRILEQELEIKLELENSMRERKLKKEAKGAKDYDKLSRSAVGKLMGFEDDEYNRSSNPIADYDDHTEEFNIDPEGLVYRSQNRLFVDDYAYENEYDKPKYEELPKRPGHESKDLSKPPEKISFNNPVYFRYYMIGSLVFIVFLLFVIVMILPSVNQANSQNNIIAENDEPPPYDAALFQRLQDDNAALEDRVLQLRNEIASLMANSSAQVNDQPTEGANSSETLNMDALAYELGAEEEQEAYDPYAEGYEPDEDNYIVEPPPIPEPAPAPEPVPSPPPITYRIQAGDSLASISRRFYGHEGGVDRIKAANNLTSDTILFGFDLIIPQ